MLNEPQKNTPFQIRKIIRNKILTFQIVRNNKKKQNHEKWNRSTDQFKYNTIITTTTNNKKININVCNYNQYILNLFSLPIIMNRNYAKPIHSFTIWRAMPNTYNKVYTIELHTTPLRFPLKNTHSKNAKEKNYDKNTNEMYATVYAKQSKKLLFFHTQSKHTTKYETWQMKKRKTTFIYRFTNKSYEMSKNMQFKKL